MTSSLGSVGLATSLSIRVTSRPSPSWMYVVTRPLGAVSAATFPAASYVRVVTRFQVPSAVPAPVQLAQSGGIVVPEVVQFATVFQAPRPRRRRCG